MAINGNYVIQCRDVVSDKVGDFLIDEAHYKRTGEFKAISPIFSGLVEFYKWDNANGARRHERRIDKITA